MILEAQFVAEVATDLGHKERKVLQRDSNLQQLLHSGMTVGKTLPNLRTSLNGLGKKLQLQILHMVDVLKENKLDDSHKKRPKQRQG